MAFLNTIGHSSPLRGLSVPLAEKGGSSAVFGGTTVVYRSGRDMGGWW